jgi:hypothetical protein
MIKVATTGGHDMTQQGAGSAEQLARRAAGSDKLETAARAGYAVNGVMHLLIGWIALQVAFSSTGKKADQSGALGTLAGNGFGRALLWLGVVGFLGLALWQLAEAVFRRGNSELTDTVKSVAKGIVYAALAFTTLQFARGGGSSSSSQSRDFTASLLKQSGGRILVIVIGLAVLGVGIYHVYKGLTKGFLDDLAGSPGTAVERLGMAGYAAKGVALGVVGLLFVVAGLRESAAAASGLDGALKALREQPFGTALLTLVALGLIAYGVYSFARAKYAKL